MSAAEVTHDQVRQQIDRILASPGFKAGSRGPALLRYIAEKTLEGNGEDLKERTLGIEVFGRHPTYDTNEDPVVRVTASRLRHRLESYYGEPGHENEIRIDLRRGSYALEFRPPNGTCAPADVPSTPPAPTGLPAAGESSIGAAAPSPKPLRMRWLYVSSAVLAACLLLIAYFRLPTTQGPLDRFWSPVLRSPRPVLIGIGYGLRLVRTDLQGGSDPISIVNQRRSDMLAWPDAIALSRFACLLGAEGRSFQARKDTAISLADLRNGPTILIGAFNNQWAIRLTKRFRFQFHSESVGDAPVMSILDSKDPSRKDWRVTSSSALETLEEDYGIVARFFDPTTEQPVVVAAGLGGFATLAASELLTNPEYMKMVEDRAPEGWERKNLQVVFATTVIGGNSGPPRILDAYFW